VPTLAWIVIAGLLMAVIALSGSLTLVLPSAALQRLLLPLVAFAAGSLLGGALFHLFPASLAAGAAPLTAAGSLVGGFAVFLGLEQLLEWHRCRRPSALRREPLTYLILLGDALHNFLGGLGVGAAFLVEPRLGVAAWLAAAAHEIPQELGDFAVLVHGGWPRRQALLLNWLSGLTFLVGAVVVYGLSARLNLPLVMSFAAGNFVYIGAADLVPEVTRAERAGSGPLHFASFLTGAALMYGFARLVPDVG
jgi:zinc and cadmium transporter